MPTTFRPYEPDQLLLLAPDVRDWLPEGHFAHHVSDLVDGLDLRAFYAPYEGDGRRNAPYEPRMMVKVLVYGYATGVFSSRGMARKLEEGRGVSGVGGGELSEPPHAVRVSPPAPGGVQGVVRGGGAPGARDGAFEFREAVDRRDEGSGEREQAQGDELRSDARGGAAFGGGNRSAAEAGTRHRCGGRRALWRVAAWRRVARGVAPSRGSVGGDCCGEGAVGGGATRGGRCARAAAGVGAQSQGWAAVQARLRGTRRQGAKQLHRPGQRHHEDRRRGVPAMLQRAGGGRWRASVDCRDGVDIERERPGQDDGVAR